MQTPEQVFDQMFELFPAMGISNETQDIIIELIGKLVKAHEDESSGVIHKLEQEVNHMNGVIEHLERDAAIRTVRIQEITDELGLNHRIISRQLRELEQKDRELQCLVGTCNCCSYPDGDDSAAVAPVERVTLRNTHRFVAGGC
jgi:hypothetical protein